jgi:hypothetical protein
MFIIACTENISTAIPKFLRTARMRTILGITARAVFALTRNHRRKINSRCKAIYLARILRTFPAAKARRKPKAQAAAEIL